MISVNHHLTRCSQCGAFVSLSGGHACLPMIDRFWAKVVKSDENSCWLWQGTTSRGYGQMWDGHRLNQAHRFAYELLRGPIPAGLHIDHLCRVRACVNPAHLEVVTCRENILRGESLPARNAQKTTCVNGHALTPENVEAYGWKQRGRRCRMCVRAKLRRLSQSDTGAQPK